MLPTIALPIVLSVPGGLLGALVMWRVLPRGRIPAVEELTPWELDLIGLILRLEQVEAERPADGSEHWVIDRVLSCDLPRMRAHVNPASMAAARKCGR